MKSKIRAPFFIKLILTLGISTLFASAVALAEGAVVIKDFQCHFLDGADGVFYTDQSQAVITQLGADILRCQADGVPNPGQQNLHFDFGNTGFYCNVEGLFTDNWHETLTPNGRATLICVVPHQQH